MTEEKKKAKIAKGSESAQKKGKAKAADASQESPAEVKSEASATETEQKAKVGRTKRGKKRSVATGHLHIVATYNNTIVTVTEPGGSVLCWSSAGASGFKGTRKSTPYAAQVAMENALSKAKNFGMERVHVFIKGIGVGRDQALRAIPQQDIEVESITDRTALRHGGCRPRRMRRI